MTDAPAIDAVPDKARLADVIEASAPAKINLALHVTGQRGDGYHELDSFVVFADVMDSLTLTPSDAMRMKVNGTFADGVPCDASNIAWKAAELCGQSFDITLTKNIPHGAGLGGGSSDAAAVLRSLDHADFAAQLGADVPVCLWAGPQRMRGIGDVLDRVWPVPQFALVLVNPGVHVATPDVFAELADKTNPPMTDLPEGMDGDWIGWLADQRNDLQPAAISVAPVIADALAALEDAQIARMSGSGSTCFGIYPDLTSAEAAAARIAKDHPDWWVTASQTVGASLS
jgi:4-diphosphocytidyl-2-C-methyl-D-erythritol kinase